MNFVYFPLTTTIAQATPVVLEAGAEVAIEVTAPAVPAVAVGGRVVDAGGDPVQDATTTLTGLDELWPRATRVFIGEAGKFEVTLPPLQRDR